MEIIYIILAYCIGSISSAILVCAFWRLPDPRETGSHNPGATNVLRIGGRIPALVTLAGDVLKGTFPVALAVFFELPSALVAMIGFAAFAGHLWPIFFRFQGGKGVATAIGVWIALSFYAALFFLAVFAVVLVIFRYVSLASMAGALAVPFFMAYTQQPIAYFYMSLSMAIILVIRHHSNLTNLWKGQENKLF